MIMDTAEECICCQELSEVQLKCQQVLDFELGEKPTCICIHPGFQPVCLNLWNLQAVFNEYRQKFGQLEGSTPE
jgi:hypothetical protein